VAQTTTAQTLALPLRARLLSIRTEPLALAGLVVVAALLRLPYLWSMPQFTDETQDSLRSFSFYLGQRFPLTDVSDYIGGLYNWLEAGAFVVFGPSIYTPRLFVCLLGSLALVATYLLAREMLGRPAAWLATALLATSGVHIGGNSHVAWSHEATPLFLALALTLLYRALRYQSGPALLGAAFLGGLTLQTHGTVAAFLPGVAVYFLWKGRALLRTRWPYLAACIFLVAYSNVIVYNLTTGFHSLKYARTVDTAYGTYGNTRARDLPAYLANQGRVLVTLLRLPAGAVDARPEVGDYLGDPLMMLYAGLTAGGMLLLARAGNPLPALLTVSALLVFPLSGAHHEVLPRQGRYLAPLLPLLFISLAAAAWRAADSIAPWLIHSGVDRRARSALGLAAAALLVLVPLIPLQRYYAQGLESGQTNERFFRLLDQIEAGRRNDELVLLDSQLENERLGGGGTPLLTLDYMLTLRGIPHREITLDADKLARRYASGRTLVVLSEKTYRTIGAELPLEPPFGQRALTPPSPYGVYMLGASGARAQPAQAPDRAE
jgi:4-amino-4-deoxy-L-arabinose transferase-like glycosyltransferase